MARYTIEGNSVEELSSQLMRVIAMEAAEQVVAAITRAFTPDQAPHLTVVDGDVANSDEEDTDTASDRGNGNDDGAEWISRDDAAAQFGLSASRIYRLGKTGEVRTSKGPRRAIMYSTDDLRRLAAA